MQKKLSFGGENVHKWSLTLTQTVGGDAVEQFNKCKTQIQQQEQKQISWIAIGEYQPLPVIQFVFDSINETTVISVRQR